MPAILIIAHEPLASALKSVAEHTYPDCSRTTMALDVRADAQVEEVEAQARLLLRQAPNTETLVFTDVFGATPCNAAQRLTDQPRVRVIAGVNVPMLWRCLCYGNESLDSMAARAVNGATQGVMQVASARPQNQTLKPGAHDQDHRHHQQ